VHGRATGAPRDLHALGPTHDTVIRGGRRSIAMRSSSAVGGGEKAVSEPRITVWDCWGLIVSPTIEEGSGGAGATR
jgi:hypothetical protein